MSRQGYLIRFKDESASAQALEDIVGDRDSCANVNPAVDEES